LPERLISFVSGALTFGTFIKEKEFPLKFIEKMRENDG
jgi:hypothetical protein